MRFRSDTGNLTIIVLADPFRIYAEFDAVDGSRWESAKYTDESVRAWKFGAFAEFSDEQKIERIWTAACNIPEMMISDRQITVTITPGVDLYLHKKKTVSTLAVVDEARPSTNLTTSESCCKSDLQADVAELRAEIAVLRDEIALLRNLVAQRPVESLVLKRPGFRLHRGG